MFKPVKSVKGEETRARILDAALRLFRQQGFETTTMREVAEASALSLGAAYHYFPSKEAIVLAYYDRVQDAHAARVRAALPALSSARARLAETLHAKLEILAHDRPLMGALLRFTGEPSHPLSFLGEGTREIQMRSMALFADALDGERLPKDLRALVPVLAWALHMGLLLYFLYDSSPNQARTKRLTDGAVELFVIGLGLVKLPLLRPVRRRVVTLLSEAGLLPSEQALSDVGMRTTVRGSSALPS